MDIEKRRGITVRASTTSIIWNGVKCNIIDLSLIHISFSEKCVKDVTTVTAECAGVEFTVKGSVVKQTGWRAVYGLSLIHI